MMDGAENAMCSSVVAPLLSTAAVLAADVDVPLDDGQYEAPVEVAPGVTYTGAIAGHKLSGSGQLTCKMGTFTGVFDNNVLSGHGSFNAAAAALAESAASDAPSERANDFTASISHSHLHLNDGALDGGTVAAYEGEWVGGMPQGQGRMQWHSGDCYEGVFDQGQPHGGGRPNEPPNTFTYADGRVYSGEFQHGVREGRGRVTQPNGDVYEGQFVRGTITGFGTVSYGGGVRVFRGLLDNGRKVRGTLKFPDTQRGYDGEWQEEVPHGAGCMTFANGDFYRGDFTSGELHGVGCLHYQSPAGKVYYGQFLHGQPYGRGFLYEPAANSASGSGTAEQEDGGSTAAPAEATVTEGYFQNGLVVADGDAEVREAVMDATRNLRSPEATAPSYSYVLQSKPFAGAAALTNSFTALTASFAAPATGALPSSDTLRSSTRAVLSGSFAMPRLAATPPPTPSDRTASSPPLPPSLRSPPPAMASSLSEATLRSSASRLPHTDRSHDEDDDEAIVSVSEEDVEEPEANAAAVAQSGDASLLSMAMGPLDASADGAVQGGSYRGWLEKCSIGRRKLGLISNWKKRYFFLAFSNDNVCLGYYEDELCRKPIGFIRLNPTDTRLVTCPTTRTHKKASRPGRDLCVIYHEKEKEFKLLLRARDPEDHDRWVVAFRSFFPIVDRATDYPLHAVLV